MSLTPMGAYATRSCLNLILLSSFWLLISCGAAFAQGGVGSSRGLPGSAGGIHTIQGRIYFPSGKADMPVRVRLEGNVVGINSTSSNSEGSFNFRSLPAGNYYIVIDAGPDYEPFREAVTIYGSSGHEGRTSPQTVSVQVNLKLKGSSNGNNATHDKVPKAARESYVKGMEAAAKGDNKKAVEHLVKAIEFHPQFGLAFSQLGVQYLKLGQPEKAGEALREALKLMPDDAAAHLNYGISLLNQKKFPEAEEQLRVAVKKNEKAPTAHMYLGIVLISRNNLEEAEKELLLALSSKSTEVGTAHKYLGGVYWGKRDYKRAADELETYLKLYPKAADAERTRSAIKELRSKQ